MAWAIFLWHTLVPVVPTERHLNATVYPSIVTDHVYLFSVLPAGYGTMSESSKQRNWFLEHDSEFSVHKWLLESPDSN